MRQKKIIYLIGIILVTFALCGMKTKASEVGEAQKDERIKSESQIMDYSVSLFNWEAIENIEAQLKESMPQGIEFDLKEEVMGLLKGEKRFTVASVLDLIGKLLFAEVGLFMKLGARFILIVLLCNILQSLTSSFKAKQTTKICFIVCYMVIIFSVIQSFVVMVEVARDAITHMTSIMWVCIPTLLAFMATTGYISSAAAMAPVIISALSLTTTIINQFVLPCIVSVVVLQMLSAMSEEFKVDKFIKLFYDSIKWVLKSILAITVLILGIYRATLPHVDVTVRKATLKFGTAFIPVVGNATSGILDFVTSCSALVKNTFAIGVMMWIVVLVSLPLIKIFAYVFIYRTAGAIIEPIGDKKMANIATKMAKGCEFIMSAVGIVALICMASLLICMSVGGQR